ncbi:MAG TPA: hypothetical protein ENJ31_13470 [Anaerolineae bacterium]|nr:hypothetical protein [Anaerolineae bacterium]
MDEIEQPYDPFMFCPLYMADRPRTHCRTKGDVCPYSKVEMGRDGRKRHTCEFHKDLARLRSRHEDLELHVVTLERHCADLRALLLEALDAVDADEQARRESWPGEVERGELVLDLGGRIRQSLARSPVPEPEDRILTDGVALIDVYGDGDVILAVPALSDLDDLIEDWQALDRRYCEIGREGDWLPIQEWLKRHSVPLLKLQRKTL